MRKIGFIFLIVMIWIYIEYNKDTEKIGLYGPEKGYIPVYDPPIHKKQLIADTIPKKTGEYIPPNGWVDINK